MKPLVELPAGAIRGLLFDIDDTLTTRGKLTAEAYAALERLHAAGSASVATIRVVVRTSFVILMLVLSRYAFGPLTRAVEAREKALQAAIDAARADRDAAAKLLSDDQAWIQMSFRFLTDDHFWFTFFHEVGHLILHPNQEFVEEEGFEVEWVEDRRQRERFGGEPEVVGGIPVPYEFLVGRRR